MVFIYFEETYNFKYVPLKKISRNWETMCRIVFPDISFLNKQLQGIINASLHLAIQKNDMWYSLQNLYVNILFISMQKPSQQYNNHDKKKLKKKNDDYRYIDTIIFTSVT